jgi:hypothetical protein
VNASDPRQAAPSALPDGDKQPQAAVTGEPQDRNSGRPRFIIEVWASPQLRELNPGRALSLSEALGRRAAAGRDREPDPEPEIEP